MQKAGIAGLSARASPFIPFLTCALAFAFHVRDIALHHGQPGSRQIYEFRSPRADGDCPSWS